ncbi:MAG: carboxyvinyl-carboxyphosphonate phosphorylmutase, partial [Myxococcota bacterium]
ELARIAGELPLPTVVNLVEGGRTPLVPHARLGEMGFKVVLQPVTALLAGLRAARVALESLRRDADPAATARGLEDFEAANELLGFDEADAFLDRHR